jgi:hypothetical protein
MIYLHASRGADRAIADALPVELEDDHGETGPPETPRR